jgi:hypothetical protein
MIGIELYFYWTALQALQMKINLKNQVNNNSLNFEKLNYIIDYFVSGIV